MRICRHCYGEVVWQGMQWVHGTITGKVKLMDCLWCSPSNPDRSLVAEPIGDGLLAVWGERCEEVS